MRFGGLIVAFDGDAVSLELLQRMGTVDLLSNWRTAAPAERRRWKLAAGRLAEAGLVAEPLVLEKDYSSLSSQEELAAEVTVKLQQLSSGLEILLMDDWSSLGGSVEGLAVAALLVGRYAAQHGCSVFVAAAPGGDPGAWSVVISQMLQAIAREKEVQDASDTGTSEDAVNVDGDS